MRRPSDRRALLLLALVVVGSWGAARSWLAARPTDAERARAIGMEKPIQVARPEDAGAARRYRVLIVATAHFSDAELACRCGCGMLPARDFMKKVEALRAAYGKPMRITSTARCPAYNAKVSATGRDGPHTTGRAIDIGVSGREAQAFLRVALRFGNLAGIGINQKGPHEVRFIHLDDLSGPQRPWIWSY